MKNIYLEKDSLYFGKWNFLTLRLKKCPIFAQRSPHHTFQPKLGKKKKKKKKSKKIKKNPPGKKFLIFQEVELLCSNIKKNQETETLEKTPYISDIHRYINLHLYMSMG